MCFILSSLGALHDAMGDYLLAFGLVGGLFAMAGVLVVLVVVRLGWEAEGEGEKTAAP
eukprot:COSAG02_NODE_7953_length_2773_cov_2.439043_4_plen_58_part_00